jgi:hypothetical protein
MTGWSDSEVATLKDHYHTSPKQELLKLLPNRSYPAIKNKAGELHLKMSPILKVNLAPPPKLQIGISEAEIRAKHDNLYKLREGCKKLVKGFYLTDQQMRETCRIGTNVWRGFSEKEEFQKYKCVAPGDKIYWGVPDSVKRLQEDINGL